MASTVITGSPVTSSSQVGTRSIFRGEYTTLSELRTFLSLASADIGDDSALRKFIIYASRTIDRHTHRHFYPFRRTGTSKLVFDLPEDSQQLRLDDFDILEIKGLSDTNGASEIDSNVYWLKTGDRWNMSPYERVIIDRTSGSVFKYSGTDIRAIHVDAVVGFNSNYNNAWINSDGSLTATLNATTTIASVSSSAAENSWGLSPRFAQGQIWKIGSGSNEEYAYVQDTINASSVRLIRGINGTTAAQHSVGTQIHVWETESDIQFAAVELAAFMYHKSKSPFTNRIYTLQLGVFEQPETWPEQAKDRIEKYVRYAVYSI